MNKIKSAINIPEKIIMTVNRIVCRVELRCLHATTVRLRITDKNYKTLYKSSPEPQFSLNDMESAVLRPYHIDADTLLKSHAIHGSGYVFWLEDISAMNSLLDQLRATQSELIDTGDILQEENRQRAHWLRIIEENRLYDMVEKQTFDQIKLMKQLISDVHDASSLEEARRLLAHIVIVGTYIKRRSNLIFVDGQNGCIAADELRLCIKESISSLHLYGIECNVTLDVSQESLKSLYAYTIYDIFEIAVEQSIDGLDILVMHVEENPNCMYRVNISLMLNHPSINAPDEENESQTCKHPEAEIFKQAFLNRLSDERFSCISKLDLIQDDDMTWCLSAFLKEDA